jgi:phosphoserine phosphatase
LVCNRFEVDASGLYTGNSVGPLCFGHGKLDAATAFCRDARVALSECAFYTDSFTDLPVLLAVREPIAVNPDRRLKRAAQRRGWSIVDWGTPTRASRHSGAGLEDR